MYGENGGELRAALTVLLRQHRIQQRIGGQGLHTLPESTTVQERTILGEQIARYRRGVLGWCLQAVRAADPQISLEAISRLRRGPVEELQSRLEAATRQATAGLPRLEELTAEQAFPLVETWRRAARAAALGEHDFEAGVGYGRLSDAQCRTVLKDAAEVTRAIVALDRRYANIPGWQPLKDQGRLNRAAEMCAIFAGHDQPDYTVDLRGWRPALTPIDGTTLPGITGVLQAEHNLLVHLDTFPDARSLRVVLDSQRTLSRAAAALVEPSDKAQGAMWRVRETTYRRLIHETRDLGGQLGNGGHSAGQASVVAARVEQLIAADLTDPTQVRQLDRLLSRVDERISQIIEHGATKHLYFLRVPLPQVDGSVVGLVKATRQRYIPMESPAVTRLITIARAELRPNKMEPRPPSGAAQSRDDFEAAILHRPGGRTSPDAIGA